MRSWSLSSRFLRIKVWIWIKIFVVDGLVRTWIINIPWLIWIVWILHILRFLLYFLLSVRTRFFLHIDVFSEIFISWKLLFLFWLFFYNVLCLVIWLVWIYFFFRIWRQFPKITKIRIIFWWSWASPKIHILESGYIIWFIVFCSCVIFLFWNFWRWTFVRLNLEYRIKKIYCRCLNRFWLRLWISFFDLLFFLIVGMMRIIDCCQNRVSLLNICCLIISKRSLMLILFLFALLLSFEFFNKLNRKWFTYLTYAKDHWSISIYPASFWQNYAKSSYWSSATFSLRYFCFYSLSAMKCLYIRN